MKSNTKKKLQSKSTRTRAHTSSSARRRGAPSKLTDDRMERFLDAYEKGLPINRCCEYVGIVKSTYQLWLAKGEAGTSSDYSEFSARIREARFRRERALIKSIEDDRSWQARRYLLMLIDKESYTDQTNHKIQGDATQPITIVFPKECEAWDG